MSQVTLHQIENAFIPAREIMDPDRFAGRSQEIKQAYLGMLADGANLAVVGSRGIGKSSLARQIIRISQGDTSLLKKIGLYDEGPLDFLSIYYACGKSTTNLNDLLVKLLTLKDCLADWIYDVPSGAKEIAKIQGGLNAGIARIGSEIFEERNSKPAVSEHAIDTAFQNILADLDKTRVARNGILIVIDEFDQIKDPSGFASMLKSLATNVPGVRFCIVGVAQDLQNLLKEHESADRLFAGAVISVPVMNASEINELIDQAENAISRFIRFDASARAKLIELAQGHPYIVHLLGKHALRSAYLEGIETITRDHIEATLKTVAEREADPVLEGRYKRAVASSSQREIVLKALASSAQADGEIHTTTAYKLALDEGVDNASQYVGHLGQEAYGAEIVPVRDRYYRFKDSLFRTYVIARPRLYNAADARIQAGN